MKLVITRKSLVYDISNIAYVMADVNTPVGNISYAGTLAATAVKDNSEKRDPHSLHQLFDICNEGNIDRVNRIIDLAFSIAKALLEGKALIPTIGIQSVISLNPINAFYENNSDQKEAFIHENSSDKEEGINKRKEAFHEFLEIHLQKGRFKRHRLPMLRETVREFIICMVLADWLSITLPELAGVWKAKAEICQALLERESASGFTVALRRYVPPI